MRKRGDYLIPFLDKYQQNVSRVKNGRHSKKFYLIILMFGCTTLLSFIANVYSSRTKAPERLHKINLAYDDYPKSQFLEEVLDQTEEIKIPRQEDASKSKRGDSFPSLKEIIPESESIKNDIIKGSVKRNDSLWTILNRSGLDASLIYKISKSLKKVYNLRRIRAGQRYQVKFNADKNFDEFSLETKDERVVRAAYSPENNSIDASVKPIEYEISEKTLSGKVNGSLFEAVTKEGEKSYLASRMASIFEWQVDFILDIRKGDEFKLVFEKKYRNGKFVKYGKILAAQLKNNGKVLTAIFYKNSNGKEDYYSENGKSLRKQFLKSPLRYTRISSGFTRKRYHPILKRYLPHLGIDYAAPTGTPVRAVGDGKVTWARRKGPNGHLVIIKHNSIYTTTYAHLSRYARGMKRGRYVKQGQVIGYVGSTGRSTGPHLDFHIKKYGRSINPLKLKIPSAQSITKKERANFNKLKTEMLAKIDLIDSNVRVAEKE